MMRRSNALRPLFGEALDAKREELQVRPEQLPTYEYALFPDVEE